MANKKPTTDTQNSREADASLLSVSEENRVRIEAMMKAYKAIWKSMLDVLQEMEIDDTNILGTMVFLRDGITKFLRDRNADHITTLD